MVDNKKSRNEEDGSFASPMAERISDLARDLEREREARRHAEEQWRDILANAHAGVYEIDLATLRLTSVNNVMCFAVGYTREEFLAGAAERFFTEESRRVFLERYQKIARGEKVPQSVEYQLRTKGGQIIWTWADERVLYENGTPVRVAAVARDITRYKMIEEALKASEAESRRLAEEARVMAEIGRIISSTLNIEEVYERFAQESKKLIPFDRVVVTVNGIEKDRVILAYVSGVPVLGRGHGSSVPYSRSMNEVISRTRQGLILSPEAAEDLRNEYPTAMALFDAGLKTMMIVPLIARDEFIGGLNFHSRIPHAYTERDLRLAQSIAAQIAGAVSNSKLYLDRIRAEKALVESENRLRHLSSELLLAQERERTIVAQELHDSIGANLSAIKHSLETKIVQFQENGVLPEDGLHDVLLLLQNTIEENRRIQLNLRPSVLDDLGIVPTLSWFSRETQKAYPAARIEMSIDIRENEIPDGMKIILFRIVQESVSNAIHHGRAGRIVITLLKKRGWIQLSVEDNGAGFESPAKKEGAGGGMGLLSMQQRVESSGGFFSISSHPGKGTVVRGEWKLG